MAPRTYVSGAHDPDAAPRHVLWFSPCCYALMDETDATCPECRELCEAVPDEDDGADGDA